MGILPTTAQQCFNKRYTLHSGSTVISGALQHNGKYYSSSLSLDSTNYSITLGAFYNIWGIHFASYDSLGNVLKLSLYQRPDRRAIDTWSNNLRLLPDGSFLLAAQSADTAVKDGFYVGYTNLIRFDSNGNVLMFKEFERPSCSILDAAIHNLFDMQPDTYGNWLMLSSVICNGKVRFCLRKLDKDFNEVWVKLYATSLMNHIPKHLLIESDGYVMTGGINNQNMMSTGANYYSSVLIKCDTAGDTLWSWHNTFDTTHLQYTINDIIRTKDGGYVYCGSGEGVPNYYKKEWAGIFLKGWVEKLDASRKSVWTRTIGTLVGSQEATQQNILKELASGDIMVAGGIGQQFGWLPEQAWIRGCLTRLNGVDGTIIKQRLYKSPDGNDTMYLYFNDMRQTDDGGFILAGESRNIHSNGINPIQQGWLVKVDSNGCLGPTDPQCMLSIPPVVMTTERFSIYPNPNSGTCYISYASLRGKQSESLSIKVYDLLGRVVYEQSLILNKAQTPLELNLAKGTYLIRLEDEAGNVQYDRLIIE